MSAIQWQHYIYQLAGYPASIGFPPSPVADRGVSGPWGPQFCGALCYGETQRLPAGGAGSPPVG